MRKLLFLALLFVLQLVFQAPVFASDEKIEVHITRQTTRQEIEGLQKALMGYGIQLHVLEAKYDAKDRVRYIRVKVVGNEGQSHTYEAKGRQLSKGFRILRNSDIDTQATYSISSL